MAAVPSALPDLAQGPACVPGEPVELAPDVVRLTAPNPSLMTGPGTNSYVVGAAEVVVVDPGPLDAVHLDRLVALVGGRRVRAIAVTHHHPDHAPLARALAERCGAPVRGFGHAAVDVDEVLGDGDVLEAGGARLEAWHTPGHASDHLCLYERRRGVLFSGDHLMEGSTVVIRPPDGDLTDYLREVARVRDGAALAQLLPGHGRMVAPASAAAEAVLEHRRQRGELVLDALVSHGPATAAELVGAAYPDVGPERLGIATATCWAHLLALVREGRASTSGPPSQPDAVFSAV